MKPSKQQADILDWLASDKGRHLNIDAKAGTGKTSTLIACCDRIPESQPVVLMAFNKAIASEIQAKLDAAGLTHAEAKTCHALGLRAWKRTAPKVQVEASKSYKVMDQMSPLRFMINGTGKDQKSQVARLVSYCKQNLVRPVAELTDAYREAVSELAFHHGVDDELPLTERNLELVREVHQKSFELDEQMIDFDDMLTAPVLRECPFGGAAWVMVDEAQDTNPARQALAVAMLDHDSRLIAVGDPCQAIYGFTGALSNAMEKLATELGSDTLPLNLTFRCPQTVVAHAQQWVPEFYAHESNPEGSVSWIEHEHWLKQPFKPSDVILCRLNKPIVELAYRFIREGKGCRVEGRDIGQGMLKFARRFKTESLKQVADLVEIHLGEETQRLMRLRQEAKLASLTDRCETLLCLIERIRLANPSATMADLEQLVNVMFGDTVGKQQVLTLSTVHKAKGREWDRVFLLGRNRFMPSKWATQAWELQQEANLIYVAVTRAKQDLVEVVV